MAGRPQRCCSGSCCTTDATLEPAAVVADHSCIRPPYNIQGCPWSTNLSTNALGRQILGRLLEALRPGPVNLPEWPTPCAPGLLGATSDNLQARRYADGYLVGSFDAPFDCCDCCINCYVGCHIVVTLLVTLMVASMTTWTAGLHR